MITGHHAVVIRRDLQTGSQPFRKGIAAGLPAAGNIKDIHCCEGDHQQQDQHEGDVGVAVRLTGHLRPFETRHTEQVAP